MRWPGRPGRARRAVEARTELYAGPARGCAWVAHWQRPAGEMPWPIKRFYLRCFFWGGAGTAGWVGSFAINSLNRTNINPANIVSSNPTTTPK